MNIKNFESNEKEVKDTLGRIFEKQSELMIKYKDIEGMPDYPFDINTKENQIWMKDFMWRSTEELAEAFEAWENGEIDHFYEELIDHLHFSTELAILSGFESTDFVNIDGMVYENKKVIKGDLMKEIFIVIYKLGLVGNLLRNKKWKQTEILVDVNKFKQHFIDYYNRSVKLLLLVGLSSDDIYNTYCRKGEVNKFRQESKY